MIVDSALYRDGVRTPVSSEPSGLREAREALAGENDFVWLALREPTAAELDAAVGAFGLHPLAVRDAHNAHPRPKLEHHDGVLLLVVKSLWYVAEEDAVETGEVAVFVGDRFVVTVRHGEGGDQASSRLSLEDAAAVLRHGPSAVLYTVCDQVVAGYEQVTGSLQSAVEEVEESVFSPARTNEAARIYVLKREAAEVRRAALPLRDPMRRLAAGEVTPVPGHTAPYFRNVADHLTRVAEVVDGLDALLSSAFAAHLSQVSVQQNEDMRRISAGVGLVALPTLIAGVYGMNFRHMPELHWALGYPFAMLLMAAASAGLWVFFKRSGWL